MPVFILLLIKRLHVMDFDETNFKFIDMLRWWPCLFNIQDFLNEYYAVQMEEMKKENFKFQEVKRYMGSQKLLELKWIFTFFN